MEKPKFLEAPLRLGNEAPADDEEYKKTFADAREKHSFPESPAKATKEIGRTTRRGKPHAKRRHQERVAPKGCVSMTHYGLVHAPVTMKKAMKIPDAKKAVDKEWETQRRASMGP